MEILTEFILPVLLAVIGSISGVVIVNRNTKEGIKCLLRSQILDIYYRYKDQNKMPEQERANVDNLYNAYVALKGNSFIKDVYAEIRKQDIER